ncbi:MAG: hypothetical protein B0D92_08445 [Spirochaeta sp. LUC14_002_19_P3]|nr:MAG: hypothetical protein B0D92_08445 [Spirochaeta sp. LUC14_002_19_P3]
MNRTIYLSRLERRIGSDYYMKFTSWNGLGVTFLGESTVTLLAMNFGAGNLELGIISAMLYMSGIILPIVPRLLRGGNVVTLGFWIWLLRGSISLAYLALFFINGRKAVFLILTLYGLFCILRTVGMAMINTVQKRLMVSRTQGEVLFRISASFQGTQILSRIISFIILSLKHLTDLFGLLTLQGLGFFTNILAALNFKKIPNRTKVEYKKGENIFVLLKRNLKYTPQRRILIIHWIALGQLILFAMTVPFLRRSAGFSTAAVFLFTISLSLAAFLASIMLRLIVQRTGSRPLLFFSALPTALMFLLWTFIPANYTPALFSIMGFVTMFFLHSLGLAASRLVISITPDEGSVVFNSMETFATSIIAILLGFSAGFLADISNSAAELIAINNFGLVFLPGAIGALLQAVLICRVPEAGSLSLRESLRIIINIDNLKTWQTLSNLEATADPVKRRTLVQAMGHSRAPIASHEIGKILSEPLSHEKGELIDSLFFTPRPELLYFLCTEALEPLTFHRDRAIFALGAYPGERTEEVLEILLHDPDKRIQAIAAKSLGRIGSTKNLELIHSRWQESSSLHQKLDYMIALFHADPEHRYIYDLFSEKTVREGERAERTYFTLLTNQFGMVPALGLLYREESARYGMGLELLLEESRDTKFVLDKSGELIELWMMEEFQKIWQLCQNALRNIQTHALLEPLLGALKGFPESSADAANTLAGLYFSYQIFTSEAENETQSQYRVPGGLFSGKNRLRR